MDVLRSPCISTGGDEVNEEEGYGPGFYIALILGIIGLIGFFMVGAGAGMAGGF